jgi:hypothetical protein
VAHAAFFVRALTPPVFPVFFQTWGAGSVCALRVILGSNCRSSQSLVIFKETRWRNASASWIHLRICIAKRHIKSCWSAKALLGERKGEFTCTWTLCLPVFLLKISWGQGLFLVIFGPPPEQHSRGERSLALELDRAGWKSLDFLL